MWGAERFKSLTTGWLVGFGLVGGIADRAINADQDRLNRSQLGEALNTRGQTEALEAVDLPTMLRLPNYVVVRHSEPMDPEVAGRNRNRHANSPSRCYAEQMVTRVFYQKAAIYGRLLRASFLYREFGNAAANPGFTFAGRGDNGLDIFLARDESQVDSASAEIVSMFKANFQEYANNPNRRRQRGRRSWSEPDPRP